MAFEFLRDIVDANTKSDQKKRLARGGQRVYADDEKAKGNKRPSQNIATAALPGVFKFLGDVKAGVGGTYGLAKAGKESVFGTDESYDETVKGVHRTFEKDTKKGIFGAGTFSDDNEAKGNTPLSFLTTIAGAGTQVASEIAPVPIGKATKGVSLARRAGKAGAASAGVAGAGNAGAQLAQEGSIDPKQVAIAAAAGGALGAAVPVAGAAITNRVPLNQVGGVGRNISEEEVNKLAKATSPGEARDVLKDVVEPHNLDATARAISTTKDPNVVRNLISSAQTQEPPHLQAFIHEYGDALQSMDSGARGGIKVLDGQGGYKRTSEHSPFYRAYYKEHGRAPSKDAWSMEAKRQLESGKADEFAQKEYETLKDPDVSSLLTQPESYHAPDTTVGNTLEPDLPVLPQEAAPAPTLHEAAIPTGERQRGFLKSTQAMDSIKPEVKQGIKDIEPQTYEQKPNATLFEQAKDYVKENPEEAQMRVFEGADTPAKYDENVALGGQLILKLQKEGKKEEAVRVAERLDVQGREHGRGVQAFAGIARLDPEGILIYAQKQIRKSREGQKDFSAEKPVSQDIKKQVESFSEQDKPVVQKAIKDTVEELSTGEKLAKKVDKAATPAKKKETDMLVNELTKRVKQEHLAPRETVKTPPLQILQEVFGRTKEAGAAYPEAQSILRSKYAGDAEMSAALDKFFKSDLGSIPAASTTVDRAIQEQLRQNKVSVMKAIYKSWANQKQSIVDVAHTLTKEGFDEQSASTLAVEVVGRLNKQFGEAKARTLERLAKDAPERARATYIDKVNKLSNIGALDKADYIDLARARLNLPNLSTDTAERLSELSQKIQTLPEGAERYATIRQMKQLIGENTPLTGKQKVAQLFATPRALLASGDISFGGRQAISYATAHPIKFIKQWGDQFKYFKEGLQGDDSQAFDELMGQIQSHPDYELLEKSPLAITDPHGITPGASEEQFIGSHYAEKVPAVGRLVRGSNYAFTGLANSIRAHEFYDKVALARDAGIPLSDKLINDLAEVINTSTGRGHSKPLEKLGLMKSLSTVLFAPRLIASRVQMFNPQYYIKLEPMARREALRSLLSLSAFAVGTMALAEQAGLDIGTNPKSSDFGKIKVGNTRLDFLGGHAQYIRLGTQLATGETVSSLSGRESQLGSGYGKKSRKDIVTKFLENKENPVVSFGTTLLAGQDAVGNTVSATSPKDVGEQTLSRFVPLIFQDIADLKSHEGALNPVAGGALAAVGIGTQTYGKQDIKLSDKQKAYVDSLEKSGASKEQVKANKDFYQTMKTTPDRDIASEKINKALEKENYDEATKIADDYNNKYASTFKDWAKKYGKYEDAKLAKDYSSKKIILDSGNIRTRIKNIRKNSLTSATLGG